MANPFNWRAIAPATLKAYTVAAREFETVTGLGVDRADLVSLSCYQHSMEARGLAVNTIRQRLSAVCVISGAHFVLPAREKGQTNLLNTEQVRRLMAIVTDKAERLLLVRLLTVGPMARTMRVTVQDTFRAHFLAAEEQEWSPKMISRKLQRYARKAGISGEVNMRSWCQTGRHLMREQGIADLLSLLSAPVDEAGAWKPLHGIGRRSHTVQA